MDKTILNRYHEGLAFVENTFRLGLMATAMAIVFLQNIFKARPPNPGQKIRLHWTDDNTGEHIDLGEVEPNQETIEELRSYKERIIQEAICKAVELFDSYFEEIKRTAMAETWVRGKVTLSWVAGLSSPTTPKTAQFLVGP